jgi:hypothetical protein
MAHNSNSTSTDEVRVKREASVDGERASVRIATYPTYPEAEAAVDYLADHDFPVDKVTIVGRGVKLVERVIGPMNWWRAALQSAAPSAVVGLTFGIVIGMMQWADPYTRIEEPWIAGFAIAGLGLLMGIVIGSIFGMAWYATLGGRRDFDSLSGIEADSYELLAEPAHADAATRLLDQKSRS